MKPTKNRIYCPACGRPKMQFESRQKADKFIRFNSDEIKEEHGKAPVRSYYCTMCCAWHVMSKPEELAHIFDNRDKRLLSRQTIEKNKTCDIDMLNKYLDTVDDYLMRGNPYEAERNFRQCSRLFNHLSQCNEKTSTRFNDIKICLETLPQIIELTDEARAELFKSVKLNQRLQRIQICHYNYTKIRAFDKSEQALRDVARSGNCRQFNQILGNMINLIQKFKGLRKNELTKQYAARIDNLKNEYRHLLESESQQRSREAMLYVIDRLEELPYLLENGNRALGQHILNQCRMMLGICNDNDDSRFLLNTIASWETRISESA